MLVITPCPGIPIVTSTQDAVRVKCSRCCAQVRLPVVPLPPNEYRSPEYLAGMALWIESFATQRWHEQYSRHTPVPGEPT